MAMEERGKGSERWSGAITNLTEMASNLESLQKLLLKKAVFVEEETFAKASLSSEQARTIKVLHSLFDFHFFFFVFNFILFFILFTYSDLGFSFLACFCLIYSVFNRFTIHNWTKCSWFLYWNSLIWFFRLCYLIVKLWDSINVTFDN